MKIFKEVEIKNPHYVTTIENGVTLLVFDGYAEGSDGKTYYCIDKEIGDDEYEFVGWSCER